MIRQMLAVAKNDLAIWRRSPAAIAAALLPALGMGILVAVLTSSAGQQPVALVVADQGRLAQRMAKILAADKDAYLPAEMTAADAEHAIGEQKVAAIIAIPEDFDEAAASGAAVLDLYLNNVDIDLADDIRRAVTRSAAELDAPQLGLTGELHGPSQGVLLPNPYRVAIAEHDLRETNVTFLQYQVTPILVLIVVSAGLLSTALLTARDFERGTARLMLLSPAGRLPLVAGRLLGGTLVTAMLVAPAAAAGFFTNRIPYCAADAEVPVWAKLFFSAPCAWMFPTLSLTHAAAMLALLLATALTMAGMGTLIGITVRDERLVTMIGLNAAIYLFFLGGGFTTVAFLPGWLGTASRLMPTSYAIEGLRQALFYPDLAGFGRDLAVLSGCAAVSMLLAGILLTRAWRRV